MSDSTPRRPRHALADGAAVPAQSPADDPTQVLPAVPAQRSGLSPSAFAPVPPPRTADMSTTTRIPVSTPPAPRSSMTTPPPAGVLPTRGPRPAGIPPWVDPISMDGSVGDAAVRHPVVEPRRRAVTAALAGVTALLLVGGIVVGIGGGAGTDLTDRPAPAATP